jgi:purine-nucleoside phosphorylase
LAGLADRFDDVRRVEYSAIPGFPVPTVVGHPGVLVAGTLAGRPAVALAGRFHMYEGHDATLSGFPARVFAALGAEVLFVSNAAGGIRRTFRPGDLMVIGDHVNLTGRNPLLGPVEAGTTISRHVEPTTRICAPHSTAGKRAGVALVRAFMDGR